MPQDDETTAEARAALIALCRDALDRAFAQVPLNAGDILTVTVPLDDVTRDAMPELLQGLTGDLGALTVAHTQGVNTITVSRLHRPGTPEKPVAVEDPAVTIARLEGEIAGLKAGPKPKQVAGYVGAAAALINAIINVIQHLDEL